MKLFGPAFWIGVLGGIGYWFWRYLTPRHSSLVLQDKVVVLTGVSSGLGQALALSFARRGSRVALVSRHPERLEVTHREIEPYASAVLNIEADITAADHCDRIVQSTIDTFEHIDVLVNSSGFVVGGLLTDYEPEKMAELTNANINATILLTRLILPLMLERNEGYIINLGSSMGRTAAPAFAPYVATQYGLAGFSDSLRRELAGTGIHVLLALTDEQKTEIAAEAIVDALVQGQSEVILGSLRSRLGLWFERYLPAAARLYWTWVKNQHTLD